MKTIFFTLAFTLLFSGLFAQNWEVEFLFTAEDSLYFGSFADLDNDLDVDYHYFFLDQEASYRAGLENATFSDEETLLDLESNDFVFNHLTVDVDLDGDLDIVSISHFFGELNWYENLGGFVFGEKQIMIEGLSQNEHLIAHDMDNDGDLDFILNTIGDGIIWVENNVLLNEWNEHTVFQDINWMQDLRVLDLDNDGDDDIIIANNFWLENDGLNNFSSILIFENPVTDHLINKFYDFTDVDGDNDLDCVYHGVDVVDSEFIEAFYWAENNGAGLFIQEHYVSDGNLSLGVAHKDFDNDGDLDLIFQGNDEDLALGLHFIEKNEDATYEPAIFLVETEGVISDIESHDLDQDGFLDIVFRTQSNQDINWVKNGFAGCTDPSACNYSLDALYDNGTCCYGNCGCIDTFAANYSSTADCEDGSCLYNLEGIVFFDENEDGIQDLGDFPLANIEVFIESLDVTSITNVNGEYLFTGLQPGDYTVETVPSDLFPFVYPSPTQEVSILYNQEALLTSYGMSNDLLDFEIGVSQYSNLTTSLCSILMTNIITYQNLGNVSIDGTVEFNYSELYQGYLEITPIESVDGNVITYAFQDLQPGESRTIYIELITPLAEDIGETVISSVDVTGLYDEEPIAYGSSTIEEIVTCAYDPNDKQVFPAGVGEDHYVFDDQELEYLIRFQNTGNAPATTVLISDTIDENLNLDSFELIGYSHPVNVSIHADTRIVDFLFAEIMLPDSINNEPESHGFVSYKITPFEDAPLLTEINNTAFIYFDNNEAIATNTTWSTLYDCSLFEVNVSSDGSTISASEGVSFQWYLEGVAIYGATQQTYTAEENGNYSVEVVNGMDCLLLSEEINITDISVPELIKNRFSIYPNPMKSSSILNLGSTNEEFLVRMYSIEGRLIKDFGSVNTNQLEISRAELTAGQYLIEIVNQEQSAYYYLKLMIK